MVNKTRFGRKGGRKYWRSLMVLVFQKNVKMLEIGIRSGVIILRVDITSYHRHHQVAYNSSCYRLLVQMLRERGRKKFELPSVCS